MSRDVRIIKDIGNRYVYSCGLRGYTTYREPFHISCKLCAEIQSERILVDRVWKPMLKPLIDEAVYPGP